MSSGIKGREAKVLQAPTALGLPSVLSHSNLLVGFRPNAVNVPPWPTGTLTLPANCSAACS